MLNSSSCNYSDAQILVKGTMTITDRPTDTNAATKQTKKGDQKVIFKNCGSFTDCINEINNTQVDNTKDLDVVMSMYNLIKCSDNYSKTYGCL